MNQIASSKAGLSRRGFMVGIGGLSFAFALDAGRSAHAATAAPDAGAATFAPEGDAVGTPFNPWVSIAPNGEISIMAPATEMGQGSLTSLPLILAEELDADWSKVVAVPAPPIDKIYGNPAM